MNNTNLTFTLVNLALTTAPIVLLITLIMLRSWMLTHRYNTQYLDLVIKGAGAAYGYLAKNNQRITNGAAVISAIEYGLEVVMRSPNIEAKMDAIGVTPTYTKTLINAELGRLAAADPTISVGASPDVPTNMAVAIAPGSDDVKAETAAVREAVSSAIEQGKNK